MFLYIHFIILLFYNGSKKYEAFVK